MIFGIIFFCLSSCGKCDGIDIIHSISELSINSFDSIKKPINNKIDFSFSLGDKITSRNGDRKCRQEDLAVSQENMWLENNFILKCSNDLINNNDTLKANTNLLNSNILQGKIILSSTKNISSSESNLFISQITSNNLINKNIKFFISGKTNKNETFSDSCSIKIIP